MNKREFLLCGIITACFVGAAVGWAVVSGNLLPPALAVVLGLIADCLCRSRVVEPKEKRAINEVGDKACRLTFKVFTIAVALVGTILVLASNTHYVNYRQAGFALVLAACSIFILYTIFNTYYILQSPRL